MGDGEFSLTVGEDDDLYAIQRDHRMIEPSEPGVEGVDELAEALGVEPVDQFGADVVILGESGKTYPLVELIRSHVEMMQRVLNAAQQEPEGEEGERRCPECNGVMLDVGGSWFCAANHRAIYIFKNPDERPDHHEREARNDGA